jgi:peptidoglycan/LPS O-acetylase OafA/YrhL
MTLRSERNRPCSMNPSSNFRADINGLRALAVILVVLFHFGIGRFHGGFVGVDIFFVISGYLMTRIIAGGLIKDRFSLGDFYLARARRILPALIVVCLAVLLYGVAQTTPPDLARLGKHAVESMTFTSNIFYWSEFNYFDADNFDKWLLHTWSLSVEWQFYLIYPIALMASNRIRHPRAMYFSLVALFLISLAASLVCTTKDSVFAFYMLPTRAWEMLAGGIVALSPETIKNKNPKILAVFTGLALIAFSAVGFDSHTPWPGGHAAVPVLGTCLVILADAKSRLTSNSVVATIGISSYSIYLWHWPLVALMRHYSLEGSAVWTGVGIATSVIVGWMSQRLIEAPALKALQNLRPSSAWTWVLTPTGLSALLGFAAYSTNGLPGRAQVAGYERAASEITFAKMSTGWCHADFSDLPRDKTKEVDFAPQYADCYFGDKASNDSAILWGDSHAAHFAPYIDVIAKSQRVKVRQLTSPGCKPLIDGDDTGTNPDICLNFRKHVLETLSPTVPVIIGARWDDAAARNELDATLNRTLKRLDDAKVKVILLGEVPNFPTSVEQKYVYERTFGVPTPHFYPRNTDVDAVNKILKTEAEKFKNVVFVDPAARLCASTTCTPRLGDKEAYFDANHLSISGAQTLAHLDMKESRSVVDLLVR